MNIKRILLTGDDGYNSIGIRMLVSFLKDRYELAIAATKTQQSAVGGHMSVMRGGTWGQTSVDGIPAVWSSTYPADAVEVGEQVFKKKFDLVISGINLGVNIGGGILSSGTFAAAHRAVDLGIAPVGIAMSWDTHHSLYHKEHDGREAVTEYVDYPGSVAYDLLTRAIRKNLWGAKILNINFPANKTRSIRFTKPLSTLRKFYKGMTLDKKNHSFTYSEESLPLGKDASLVFDADAVLHGFISVSLYKMDFIDERLYAEIKNKEMSL